MRHLVLVGGGHSHIQVLKAFAESPPPECRLTVIVDRVRAVYSGMVPGFVAGMYDPEDLEIDVATWAERAGADLIPAAARRIDARKKQILVDGREPVSFDIAAFNIGATVAGLDLPGVREFALPTRPIADFNRHVTDTLKRLRKADAERPVRLVVAGAGAAGVELAFCFQHRLSRELDRPVRVGLLEGGSRVLSGSPGGVVRRIRRHATKRDIAIRCNARVHAVQKEALLLEDGDRIPYDILLWATGAASRPLFDESDLPTDERGFVRVTPTLQIEGHETMFASGDCAALSSTPAPKAGVYAVRQGPVIAHNLRALPNEHPLQTYEPQEEFLTLLNLGNGTAVGSKWGLSFEGRWVMVLKDYIDRTFVDRFR